MPGGDVFSSAPPFDCEYLLERAEVAPESITPDDVVDRVREGDIEQDRLFESVRVLARYAPETVERMVPPLEELMTATVDTRLRATAAMSAIAWERPVYCRQSTAHLLEVARSDVVLCEQALTILEHVSREHPAPLLERTDDVVELLDHDLLVVRARAVVLVAALSETVPGRMTPVVPQLVDRVTNESLGPIDALDDRNLRRSERTMQQTQTVQTGRQYSEAIRQQAALALRRIGAVAPGSVQSFIDPLVAAVDSTDDAVVRTHLVTVLSSVAERTPQAVSPARDVLVETLRSDASDELRAEAARTLAVLIDRSDESVIPAVAPVVPDVADVLHADEARIRANVVTLLSYVAEYDPGSLERTLPKLLALLDDESPVVRAGAVWIVHYTDVECAPGILRAVAREDSAETIRSLAADLAEIQ